MEFGYLKSMQEYSLKQAKGIWKIGPHPSNNACIIQRCSLLGTKVLEINTSQTYLTFIDER